MPATDLKRDLNLSFDMARERVIEALKGEGFGVLTEIDVKQTLKNKINVDFRRYNILGACNPTMAYQALSMVDDIGLFLPCNVAIYEVDDTHTTVAIVDPNKTIANAGVDGLDVLATEVHGMLARVLESVSEA